MTKIEQSLSNLPPITALLDQGLELEELLDWIVEDVQVMEHLPIVFRCQCSKERVEQTLISLGEGELQAMIEEDGKAEVVCHFCNETYAFDREQLQSLIDQMNDK